MMRNKLFGIVFAALAAWPAMAAPTYLHCQMPAGKPTDPPIPFTIALNEDAGTVTWSNPVTTRTEKAQFAPDTITYNEGGTSIDRTTLKMTHYLTYRGQKLGEPRVGQCKIDTKKRAI